MSVSVRLGICFGSAGFALRRYMKPTLLKGPRGSCTKFHVWTALVEILEDEAASLEALFNVVTRL